MKTHGILLVTAQVMLLFVAAGSAANGVISLDAPDPKSEKFSAQVDLCFCPKMNQKCGDSERKNDIELSEAGECLDWVRGKLQLHSQSSQGYAHAGDDSEPSESDSGILACLKNEGGRSEGAQSDRAVRDCRRRVFEDRRSYLTSVMAEEARARDKRISTLTTEIDELQKNPSSENEAPLEAKRLAIDAAQVGRNFIAARLSLPDCKALFVDHRCYDAWFANFSVGGEYNSVNEILGEKLFPRVGLLIYRNYSSYERWRRVHFFGEFRLAGAGESSSTGAIPGIGDGPAQGAGSAAIAAATADGTGEDAQGETPPEIEKALDARAAVFLPLVKIGDKVRHERRLQEFIGPLVELGIRKVDKGAAMDKRYYGGVRMSFNPEWYLDMLWGKTESVPGNRVEVRGQMPVIPIANGNHVYIGAIANFRDSNEAKGDKPIVDALQVYLAWNVDFKSILGK